MVGFHKKATGRRTLMWPEAVDEAISNSTRRQKPRFKKNAEAWSFFESLAPSYRRFAIHWLVILVLRIR